MNVVEMKELNLNVSEITHDKNVEPEIEPLTWKLWKKKRYIVAFMLVFGVFNSFTIRTIMSVAIVAMTKSKTIENNNETIIENPEFDWNSKEKGVVLSSLYYGYFGSQIIGGYIAPKFGGNRVCGFGIGISSILTTLTPTIAQFGLTTLVAYRVLIGLFDGLATGAFFEIFNQWSPPAERTRMVALAATGFELGTIASMLISGILADSFGWSSIFYAFGGFGCVWYFFWTIIVQESPSKDKYITDDERRYIIQSIRKESTEMSTIPWKSILTSRPVYAVMLAGAAHSWGVSTLLTSLPIFLKDTMNYDLKNSGILSATPYIGMSVLMPIVGFFADFLRTRKLMTTTQVRRYFTLIGFINQAIFLILVTFLMDPIGSIVCVVLAVSIGSFASNGYLVCPLDMAPQFASVIVGFSNTIGSIPALITPILTGYIVQNKDVDEWRIVFYICSIIYVFGAVIFFIIGSAEIQVWAQGNTCEETRNQENT